MIMAGGDFASHNPVKRDIIMLGSHMVYQNTILLQKGEI
jgi:hypothetical protein